MTGHELYERFIHLLEQKGISKSDFCKKSNVRLSALSNWDSRGTMPSADLALSISKICNVSVDYVLGNSDIPNYDANSGYSMDEMILIEKYRNSDEVTKDMIVRLLAYTKLMEDKGDNK